MVEGFFKWSSHLSRRKPQQLELVIAWATHILQRKRSPWTWLQVKPGWPPQEWWTQPRQDSQWVRCSSSSSEICPHSKHPSFSALFVFYNVDVACDSHFLLICSLYFFFFSFSFFFNHNLGAKLHPDYMNEYWYAHKHHKERFM